MLPRAEPAPAGQKITKSCLEERDYIYKECGRSSLVVDGATLAGTVQAYLYTIIVGIIILLIGFAIGILAKKLLGKLLREAGLNKIMSKVGVTADVEKWISGVISYTIYLFTIVLFLDQLGIRSIVLYLIAGGLLMLIILTFLVGMKDIIPNFIGWLYLQRKGKVREGWKIEMREIAGTVERIGYMETEIKTGRGDVLYVPNSLFLKSKYRVRNQ